MSTDYYRIRHPVTSVRVEPGPAHDRVSVWVDHALAGTLTVRSGQGYTLCSLLAGSDWDEVAVRRVGVGGGKVRLIIDGEIADGQCLVSEYGEVTTLRELREDAGVGA